MMKQFIIISLLCWVVNLFGQTGNVGIGTGSQRSEGYDSTVLNLQQRDRISQRLYSAKAAVPSLQ